VSTEENFPVVTLHTGATVPESVVRTTGLTLELLERVNPTALYELVRLAKDPCHELFGNTGGVLAGLGLAESDGSLASTTRDVILASPYAELGDEL
jgi:hypothetical protein